MSSRFRIKATGLVAALLLPLALGACDRSPDTDQPVTQPPHEGVIDSALTPGVGGSLTTHDPRADAYYDNAQAVADGFRLYKQYNCNGCHSAGGGGMGPSLMDDEWIYGGTLTQIHQTLIEGRPNGMPAWGGKIPDPQMWQIATYVRSLSLPETLAAQHGPTPGQTPAPVPRKADAHAGWMPPKDTTNDFTSTVAGPQ